MTGMVSKRLCTLYGAFCLLIATITRADEANGFQNGVYHMKGPSGLNLSFDATSGKLMVNRILNQPQVHQTTESVTPLSVTENSTRKEVIDQPLQQTDTMTIHLVLLQQWNTTNNGRTLQQLLMLDKCNNITDNRPGCYSFSCHFNMSSVEFGMCFGTGVVRVKLRVPDWHWCNVNDQSQCGSALLEMMFKFCISEDLSIGRAEDPGLLPNFTTFNLGYQEAFVQFGNVYNENNDDLSFFNSTLPVLTLSKSYEAKVNVTLNHIIPSPVTNLAYELIINPGNKTAREKVISAAGRVKTSVVMLFLLCYLHFVVDAFNVLLN